jgi:hypothetical protein
MNEFVNPRHRDVNLPKGFKDLMDVLEAKGEASAETTSQALHSKRPVLAHERHVQGLSQIEKFLNRLLNSKLEDALLSFMLESGYCFSLLRAEKSLEAYVSFIAGELVLERELRKIFADIGVIPVAQAYSSMRVYCFSIPRGVQLLETVTKVLKAYGISDSDEIEVVLRA